MLNSLGFVLIRAASRTDSSTVSLTMSSAPVTSPATALRSMELASPVSFFAICCTRLKRPLEKRVIQLYGKEVTSRLAKRDSTAGGFPSH